MTRFEKLCVKAEAAEGKLPIEKLSMEKLSMEKLSMKSYRWKSCQRRSRCFRWVNSDESCKC